jgi:CubicO group peptidase (beta-lactamase class C family)
MILALLASGALSVVDAAAKDLRFHGVVRVERGGTVLVDKGYGLPAGTTFWVASISKSFTAALILRLEELGKLKLSDPISRWVPGSRGITIDELLTHTAGIPNGYAAEGIADIDAAARAVLEQKPLGPRGEFHYTSDGYSLLAIVAEKAGGAPFFDLLQREVLDRAQLRHTGFWPRCLPGARVAHLTRPPRGDRARENWGFKGGEGICSTAADLAKLMRALLDGAVLSRESLARLWERVVAISGGHAARGFFVSNSGVVWTRGTEDYGHNGVVKWVPHESALLVALSDVPALKRDDVAASRAIGELLEKALPRLR